MVDSVYVHPHDWAQLLSLMALLRSPEGCPWDREQNHKSIRQNLLEEAYEVCEAIDNDDMVLLCEELGDVLLQVVFHARMEEEAGGFSIADVLDGLCRKLILRHPHVFGDAQAADAAEVLTRWDQIKRETKGQDTLYATLAAVARSLPALMRADKLVKKAAKADTASFGGAETWNRLSRGAAELPQCSARGEDAEKSVGEFLFSAVAAARLLGVDPERALERACDDFAASVGRAEGVLPPA